MVKIKLEDIREYQNRMEKVKANGFKAAEFKALGRELRDKFSLTDRQAINILNGNSDEILKILELKEFDIEKSIKVQAKLCEEKEYPHFAPSSGRCWCCGQNIYEQIGWKHDDFGRKVKVSLEEADFTTGISTEKASKELITGCPHCNRTYCD